MGKKKRRRSPVVNKFTLVHYNMENKNAEICLLIIDYQKELNEVNTGVSISNVLDRVVHVRERWVSGDIFDHYRDHIPGPFFGVIGNDVLRISPIVDLDLIDKTGNRLSGSINAILAKNTTIKRFECEHHSSINEDKVPEIGKRCPLEIVLIMYCKIMNMEPRDLITSETREIKSFSKEAATMKEVSTTRNICDTAYCSDPRLGCTLLPILEGNSWILSERMNPDRREGSQVSSVANPLNESIQRFRQGFREMKEWKEFWGRPVLIE